MTKELQTPWTLSATSEHNSAMQDFTDLCIKGDSSDLEKMQPQITTRSPYLSDPTLRNMVNVIVAGPHMNVHAMEAVGKTIIRYII
ncbi:hypothetical protein DPMN_168251 [Dreissena polymorpha]|uniref:Uncharacterized protein n=1 Tax=Dreissena polymorpha TaxID=45954 RepID=A0A9D4IVR5_DREPO|nr:hypothetical protein DPMN_168251 [Dreissena polymorpha]